MKLSLPDLRGFPVMLSASLPQDLAGTSRAQELFDVIVAVVGGVLSADGTLVFGGHPSVTPLVHRVASSLGFEEPRVALFQLRKFRQEVPKEAYDERVFGGVIWVGHESQPDSTSLAEDLAEMRARMVNMARAGIFLGGKTESNIGGVPGIRDEYERFIARHEAGPAYLLGGLGGEALRIIQSLEQSGGREPNSLSDDELADVRYADDIDFAAALVITDIRRHAASASERPATEAREGRSARAAAERPREPGTGGQRSTRFGDPLFKFPALLQAHVRLDEIAAADGAVLITGEKGAGKEALARAIHDRSRRAGGPFVVVNSGAVPEMLLESELFGHVRGAFTGALDDWQGRWEAAEGGTILLRDITEIPPALQPKLLRAIEEGEIRRVGSPRTRGVDVRVIATSERPLLDDIAQGRFRADLFYRLSTFTIDLPPSEPREDITEVERGIIEDALRRTSGNKAAAARLLGIPRSLLYEKIKKHLL